MVAKHFFFEYRSKADFRNCVPLKYLLELYCGSDCWFRLILLSVRRMLMRRRHLKNRLKTFIQSY